MKKLLLSIVLLFSITEAKEVGNTKEIIAQYIQAWQPLALDLNNEILVIPFNQERITNKIYMSILRNGICLSATLEKWNGVKKIVIMNSQVSQGYVFSGGYDTCKEASKLTGKQVEYFLLGKTSQY